MARILIIAIWIPFPPIFRVFDTLFAPNPDHLNTLFTLFFPLEHLVRPPMEMTPPPPPPCLREGVSCTNISFLD